MLRVLLGSTETITTYPRLAADGVLTSHVASSATARRVGPGASDAVTAYVAATVDSLSATTQGAHQEGDNSLTTSVAQTWVAGRRYLITDATAGREIVVVATKSGLSTELWLAEPLIGDIGNNSTVRGIAVTVALTAAQTAQPGAGYVLFRATVDGVVREWTEPFRVVRRITSIALTPTELTQAYPVIRKLASATDTTLEEAINASWRHVVVPSLAARGILDEDIMTDDVVAPMHAAATVLHLARQWPQASSEFVTRLEASYEQIKQTTWDRIDLATAPQDDATPDVPTPGVQGPRYMGITR
jgi:hypothetical protein